MVALELVVELFHWGMDLYHLLSSYNTLHKPVVDQDTILVEGLHMSTVYSDYIQTAKCTNHDCYHCYY